MVEELRRTLFDLRLVWLI